MSRGKCNQTMTFCQLIVYNIRNTFPGESYTQCDGEAITRPLSKKLKLSTSLDQQFEVLYSFYIVYQVEGNQKILKPNHRPLAFASYKAF